MFQALSQKVWCAISRKEEKQEKQFLNMNVCLLGCQISPTTPVKDKSKSLPQVTIYPSSRITFRASKLYICDLFLKIFLLIRSQQASATDGLGKSWNDGHAHGWVWSPHVIRNPLNTYIPYLLTLRLSDDKRVKWCPVFFISPISAGRMLCSHNLCLKRSLGSFPKNSCVHCFF